MTSFGLRRPESTRRCPIVLAATRSPSGQREVWSSNGGGEHWQRVFAAPGASGAPLVLPRWQPEGGPLLVGDGPYLHQPPATAPLAHLAGSITDLAWWPTGKELFAATTAGIHRSRDGGRSFTAWTEGGPRVVMALAAPDGPSREGCVFALELGGTVWRRDHVLTDKPNPA